MLCPEQQCLAQFVLYNGLGNGSNSVESYLFPITVCLFLPIILFYAGDWVKQLKCPQSLFFCLASDHSLTILASVFYLVSGFLCVGFYNTQNYPLIWSFAFVHSKWAYFAVSPLYFVYPLFVNLFHIWFLSFCIMCFPSDRNYLLSKCQMQQGLGSKRLNPKHLQNWGIQTCFASVMF